MSRGRVPRRGADGPERMPGLANQHTAWEERAQNHSRAVKVRTVSPRACRTPTPLSGPPMGSRRPVLQKPALARHLSHGCPTEGSANHVDTPDGAQQAALTEPQDTGYPQHQAAPQLQRWTGWGRPGRGGHPLGLTLSTATSGPSNWRAAFCLLGLLPRIHCEVNQCGG